MQNTRKQIKVAAAIIIDDGKIFATQRGYGQFKDGWEFPGGKIEQGETPQQALVREIREELDTEIEVGELFDTVEYDYPDFHLTMHCFLCTVKSGGLMLKEHEDSKWLTGGTLDSVEWLPADVGVIEKLKKSEKIKTVEEVFDNFSEKYGEEFNWCMIAHTNTSFVDQAKKEIKENHPLYGKTLYSVAKCDSCDDVLYVTKDKGCDLYILIHLTYANYEDVNYPKFKILGYLKAVEKYIEEDFQLNYM